MHCNKCGEVIKEGSHFCSNCGTSVPPTNASRLERFPSALTSTNKNDQTGKRTKSVGIFWLVMGAILLAAAAGILGRDPSQDSGPKTAAAPQLTDGSIVVASEPMPDKPTSSAERKAAQKVLREKWIEETQKELWRQGMEMTFQARGTTLNVEYVLAGKAFAFQFGESFVAKNAGTLRALGFKRVELLDGDSSNDIEADHRWSWNLTK
jgi:hypothetical protein